MPLESTIVRSIITALARIPDAIVWKNHGSQYSRPGMPDIQCIINGRPIFLEVKQPGRPVSAIQDDMIRRLRRAGATAVVVHSKKEALDLVRPYL